MATASSSVRNGRKYAQDTQPFTVLIEGNIGSGKTTFLNHFQKYKDEVCLITEPVEKWRNVNGVNLLEKMYNDPKKWAMPFQSYVTLTMLQAHTAPTDKKLKIIERSIYSSRSVSWITCAATKLVLSQSHLITIICLQVLLRGEHVSQRLLGAGHVQHTAGVVQIHWGVDPRAGRSNHISTHLTRGCIRAYEGTCPFRRELCSLKVFTGVARTPRGLAYTPATSAAVQGLSSKFNSERKINKVYLYFCDL